MRADVLAGGYVLREPSIDGAPLVHLAGTRAVMPEVVTAAGALEREEVAVRELDVTSGDRLYRDWRAMQRRSVHAARIPDTDFHLATLVPPGTVVPPFVTVHDGTTHAPNGLGAPFGVPVVSLGVDEFCQSGSLADLYAAHDLLPDAITNAALSALSLGDSKRTLGPPTRLPPASPVNRTR